MKAGKNCLKGSSTYVTKYTCTWLRNSTVGSEKVQLNSCLQIVQLYFLALTGIRSKITGIQEISWSEKSTADLRLCLESDVMILEMSGKKSTLVLKFLRLAFFCLLHYPEHSKEVKQGNISASFLFSSVTFCCLGKNQKHWCAEKEWKEKRSFCSDMVPGEITIPVSLQICRGICYALLICIYLIMTKNNPHLMPCALRDWSCPSLKRQDSIFCDYVSPPGKLAGLLQILVGV